MRIIYEKDDGGFAVVAPAHDIIDLDALAAKVVPQGREYQIVEDHEVPADEPQPQQPYDARVHAAMAEVGPSHVLLKEIILAMNHAQLSGQVTWSKPMNEIINQALPRLSARQAIERPK